MANQNNRASWFSGFLLGTVFGLGIAALAMVLIASAPLPFEEKVEKVTANVDPAKVLNGLVDPNKIFNRTSKAQRAESKIEQEEEIADAEPAHWIQVGAFSSEKAASDLQGQLAFAGFEAQVKQLNGLWRVRIGPFADQETCHPVQAALSSKLKLKSTILVSR